MTKAEAEAKAKAEQEAADKAAADQKAKAEAEAKAKASTVKMIRDPEQYPQGPHTADVATDEVENWKAHGWTLAKP